MSWIRDDYDDFDSYLEATSEAESIFVGQEIKPLCFLQDMSDYSDSDDMRETSGVERIVAAVDRDEERLAAEEEARRADLALIISVALMQLTPRQREYIELSFFERKRDCEIRVLLGCSKPTIVDIKRAAMANLKKKIKKLCTVALKVPNFCPEIA